MRKKDFFVPPDTVQDGLRRGFKAHQHPGDPAASGQVYFIRSIEQIAWLDLASSASGLAWLCRNKSSLPDLYHEFNKCLRETRFGWRGFLRSRDRAMTSLPPVLENNLNGLTRYPSYQGEGVLNLKQWLDLIVQDWPSPAVAPWLGGLRLDDTLKDIHDRIRLGEPALAQDPPALLQDIIKALEGSSSLGAKISAVRLNNFSHSVSFPVSHDLTSQFMTSKKTLMSLPVKRNEAHDFELLKSWFEFKRPWSPPVARAFSRRLLDTCASVDQSNYADSIAMSLNWSDPAYKALLPRLLSDVAWNSSVSDRLRAWSEDNVLVGWKNLISKDLAPGTALRADAERSFGDLYSGNLNGQSVVKKILLSADLDPSHALKSNVIASPKI